MGVDSKSLSPHGQIIPRDISENQSHHFCNLLSPTHGQANKREAEYETNSTECWKAHLSKEISVNNLSISHHSQPDLWTFTHKFVQRPLWHGSEGFVCWCEHCEGPWPVQRFCEACRLDGSH